MVSTILPRLLDGGFPSLDRIDNILHHNVTPIAMIVIGHHTTTGKVHFSLLYDYGWDWNESFFIGQQT